MNWRAVGTLTDPPIQGKLACRSPESGPRPVSWREACERYRRTNMSDHPYHGSAPAPGNPRAHRSRAPHLVFALMLAIAFLSAAAYRPATAAGTPTVSVSGGISPNSILEPFLFTWHTSVPVGGGGWGA